MIRTTLATVLLLAPLVLSACDSGGTGKAAERSTLTPPADAKETAERLTSADWLLSTIEGRPVTPLPMGMARRPSLSVMPDGSVSGFGGVNRISGRTDPEGLTQGRLMLGNLVSTRMAGEPEAMNLERDYMAALSRAKSFRAGRSSLTLMDAGGSPILTFVRD